MNYLIQSDFEISKKSEIKIEEDENNFGFFSDQDLKIPQFELKLILKIAKYFLKFFKINHIIIKFI